jgi:hypothetical protein
VLYGKISFERSIRVYCWTVGHRMNGMMLLASESQKTSPFERNRGVMAAFFKVRTCPRQNICINCQVDADTSQYT